MGDAFVLTATRLPDGEKDEAMQALLKCVAPYWREEVLPQLLTGWNLLQRSMLSPQERSTVIAAASMSVTNPEISQQLASKPGTQTPSRLVALRLPNIETALRTQWQDEELFARDDRKSDRDELKGK